MGPFSHNVSYLYIENGKYGMDSLYNKMENLVGSLATEQSHLLFHQPDPLLYQQHSLGQGVQFIVHRRKLCHHLLQSFAVFLNLGTSVLLFISVPVLPNASALELLPQVPQWGRVSTF